MLVLSDAQRGEVAKWIVMYGMGWNLINPDDAKVMYPNILWAGRKIRRVLFLRDERKGFRIKPKVVLEMQNDSK